MEGLGRLFNVVYEASGLNLNLENYGGVTFLNFLDAGTQTMTLQETDAAGANDQNLAVIDTIYKVPKGGGTWTKVTQDASHTYDHSTDATNDVIAIYVDADDLSAGFTCVEMTAGSGTCVAILHDIKAPRAAANLPTPIV